jgi:Skp family chaperone for outer membrane proteins
MKISPTALLLLLVSAFSASAAPHLALVRVKDIYTALPSTREMQEKIKAEHDAIMQDERAEQLRKMIAELQALQAQLGSTTKPLEDDAARKVARTYEIKAQEAQTLQQDFESYKTEQEKIINAKMVVAMRTSLDHIVSISQKIAKERGFSSVLDSSGNTNTGVPFVLYQRQAPDLTPEIEAALKATEAPVKVTLPTPANP